MITLRRIIYQSMLQAFHHGRVVANPFSGATRLARISTWFPSSTTPIRICMPRKPTPARRTAFSRRTGIFCATPFIFFTKPTAWPRPQNGSIICGEKYPDKPILENQPDSLPKNLTLDEYAVACVQIDIGETSQERVTAAFEGLLTRAYYDLAVGQDDRYAGSR